MGALGFSFVSPEAARAWVHRYYNTLLHRPRRLADYPVNPNIAIVNGFMCAPTDEEALEKASGWTFFIFALSHYGRKGIDAPGTGNLWREYQDWRHTEKAQQALRNGLIGSPETIRKRLRMFEQAHVDQVILLNQAGKTSHEDICASLELFAREVMPEFHKRHGEQEVWKQEVLARRIVLEELDTGSYELYAHQNEDIVRLTPEQLRQRMAEKEAVAGS
jgi:alkanesulfonate monooxygenase SsuD/methylene tetrahydromethanopterin reductase-like flavin-dependent oxidoreductase (luciferase family)